MMADILSGGSGNSEVATKPDTGTYASYNGGRKTFQLSSNLTHSIASKLSLWTSRDL